MHDAIAIAMASESQTPTEINGESTNEVVLSVYWRKTDAMSRISSTLIVVQVDFVGGRLMSVFLSNPCPRLPQHVGIDQVFWHIAGQHAYRFFCCTAF